MFQKSNFIGDWIKQKCLRNILIFHDKNRSDTLIKCQWYCSCNSQICKLEYPSYRMRQKLSSVFGTMCKITRFWNSLSQEDSLKDLENIHTGKKFDAEQFE